MKAKLQNKSKEHITCTKFWFVLRNARQFYNIWRWFLQKFFFFFLESACKSLFLTDKYNMCTNISSSFYLSREYVSTMNLFFSFIIKHILKEKKYNDRHIYTWRLEFSNNYVLCWIHSSDLAFWIGFYFELV